MVKRSRIVAFFLIVLLMASLIGTTTNPILKKIKLGLDLQGGFEVLYDVTAVNKNQKIDRDTLVHTTEALNNRINVIGVSEPSIQIEGTDRIRVQLPGVEDQNQARETLGTTATLSFRDVNDNLMLSGTDLKEGRAKATISSRNNQPVVLVELKDRKKFRDVTKKILDMAPNNQLVIWLDFEEGVDSYKDAVAKGNPKMLSAPNVNEVFNTTEVTIEGNFTQKEAENLANLLNAGALPVKLTEVYSTSVGAQFGEQALNKTIQAGLLGIAIIFIFMIAYYRFPGIIATITLSIYVYLILLIFDLMNGVLTLPGIAALILGVGMAVDANILTYERIKEEIKVGRSIKSAFEAGNKSSFVAILDANITTLLAGVVLFYFGTSSVKGFATMLIISILMSFLTAVYGSRLLLGLWVNSRFLKDRPGWFGIKRSQIYSLSDNKTTHDLPTRFDKFDFVKHRKKFYVLSTILILSGAIILGIFRLNLGIDFSSGTRVDINVGKTLTTEEVKSELTEIGFPTDDIVLAGAHNEIGVARYKGVFNKAEIAKLKTHFSDKYGSEPNVSTVSSTVGKELAKNAIYALLFAAIGIIIYVSFRFEYAMGLTSVLGLLHDAFFIVAFFSLTRLEVDITFIAAVLTIVGYSINDTIVTFDRIRENMTAKKRLKTEQDIADVVNHGLRQTLTRSINTVLTVIITVVALLILGSESIRNFAIALFVGLLAGTYSSIFISAQLWYDMKVRELKKNGPINTVKEKKKWSDEPQV
ncbi:protein translocase subunit SecDF [Lederbergia wuyishanensis]|uniref:Multifunctional fusion protein n=1 Tax=Lederbergia wuyishanensis TaxID=1347903 RepID=A0ABU0D1S4_9BACI|nr:protein translocase subunit SecDF [Lederbergia wuyishanensis]MCJ8006943.1 protein translocase subunit SecDF [Lederbergia wuyishanensis]MDQ0342327.1 SecD/SecF fusion protein [Lederbergia wuyishanensis]